VWRVAQSVTCPILASGGIMDGDDALEFLVAGASAMAVGIASSIHPTAIARITAEIAGYLTKHHLASASELVGTGFRTL
jgi:dihydroorotate dehydrogenase (NAD+) catalytic subunit